MNKINTIIVDKQFIFTLGLKSALKDFENIAVIAETSSIRELLLLLKENQIDLLLIEAELTIDELEPSLTIVKEAYPHLKIIAFINCINEELITKMIDIGIDSFFVKNISKSEFHIAIKTTLAGKNYFSKEIINLMSKNFGKSLLEELPPEDNFDSIKLTKREIEILNKICLGFSTVEIAEQLCISQRTVDGHRAKILAKTGTKNTANLLMYAVRNKIVDIKD